MPAVRTNKDRRGLYVHAPTTVTKATTGSKSGQIQTIVSRHEDTQPPTPEPSGPPSGDEYFNDDMPISPTNQAGMPGMVDDTDIGAQPNVSGITVKVPAKRYQNSDRPLLTWIEYRENYLDALLRLEGRGQFHDQGCSSCGDSDPRYRCVDCHGRRLVCAECLLCSHADQPLHVVQVCQCNFALASISGTLFAAVVRRPVSESFTRYSWTPISTRAWAKTALYVSEGRTSTIPSDPQQRSSFGSHRLLWMQRFVSTLSAADGRIVVPGDST